MDIPTLEDRLLSKGLPMEDSYPCIRCRARVPAFAMVLMRNSDFEYECTDCYLTELTEENAAKERLEKFAREEADPWDCESGYALKAQRNQLIESVRWAADPVTTPFVEEKRQEFQEYIRELNRLTITYERPSEVVLPSAPEYGPADYA